MAAALQPAVSPFAPPPPPVDDGKVENVHVTGTAPSPFSEDEMEGRLDTMNDKIKAINDSTGALQPPSYNIPPPPEAKQTSPLEAWGSSAMALAAIGSLLTRQPLTTALNAGAAAMQAFQKNDLETANQEFDRWKASADMAVKQQNFQLEAYKAALSKAATDEKQATAEFSAYAHAFGDNTAAEGVKQRGIQFAEKYVQDQTKMNDNLAAKAPQIIEGKNVMMALKDPEFVKLLQGKPPQEQAQMQAALIQKVAPDLARNAGLFDDDTLKAMAEQAWSGDTTVLQGLGYGSAGAAARVRVRNMITQIGKDKGYTDQQIGQKLAAADAEFQGLKAGERTLGTTSARIGLGSAELETLEPQVTKASDDLKRTNYPNFNAVINAGRKATGDPALKSFAVRLQGLKSAFSQVLTRGGVPTDHARSLTDDLFNTEDSGPVFDAATQAMNQETGAIKTAPGKVRADLRSSITGSGDAAPPHITTKAQYDALPSGTVYTEDDGQQYKKP